MKKVFLNDLPKLSNFTLKEKINWLECIGYRVKFVYDDIAGEIEIIDYDKRTQKISLKYINKDIFKIDTNHFQECKLGKLLGLVTSEFKIEIGTIFKNNRIDLVIVDREYRKDNKGNTKKWYRYHCNKCGWDEGWMIEHSLLQHKGCGCCCPTPRTIVEGINDIPTTAPWMVKYFQGGYDEAKLYTKSSGHSIYPICPDCGKIKDKSLKINNIYNQHTIGCGCGDSISYPNKLMYNLLTQLTISFKTEYSPIWVNHRKYDFYFKLDNKEYVVEMDGELGHGKKMHGRSKITLKESLEIDIYKDKTAKEHNIKVIRINCDKSDLDYIKENILNSELNNIFDLSNIDWKSCESFALSNLVKQVCDIKKKNSNLSTTEISEIVGLDKVTIIRYLKKGTQIGWCNYNAEEEVRKSKSKIAISIKKRCNKKVVCLETNEVYESVTEASLKTSGGLSRIASCCRGTCKTSGGYHWAFYDEFVKQNTI